VTDTRGRPEREERLDALLAEAMREAWSADDTDAVLLSIERDGRRRARGRRVALGLATAAGIAGLFLDPSARGGLLADLDVALATGADVLASFAEATPTTIVSAGASGPIAIGVAIAAAVANLWLWRRSKTVEESR